MGNARLAKRIVQLEKQVRVYDARGRQNSRSFPPQATHEHSKAPLRHLRRKKPRFLNSKRAAGLHRCRVSLAARVEACRVVPLRVVDYVAERALRRATKWL